MFSSRCIILFIGVPETRPMEDVGPVLDSIIQKWSGKPLATVPEEIKLQLRHIYFELDDYLHSLHGKRAEWLYGILKCNITICT